MGGRPGRRAGDSGTRQAILDAARRVFGAEGFDGATIRQIAAGAGVDTKLVHHFFGTKQGLFVAAVELPADPSSVVEDLVAGSPSRLGERIARWFLTVTEDPSSRARFEALIRSAASDARAAAMLRQFLQAAVLRPLAARLAVPDPELRVALAHSQLIGLFMARHVIGVEALRHADIEVLVAALAPGIQRCLTGSIEP